MVSDSRVLLGALSSFHQHTLEEISFCFTPRNLILKSHVEEPGMYVCTVYVCIYFSEPTGYPMRFSREVMFYRLKITSKTANFAKVDRSVKTLRVNIDKAV